MSDPPMDAGLVQEHIEMVDRILAEADREVRLMPAGFIAFGIAGGLVDVLSQLIYVNGDDPRLQWIAVLAWVTAFAITITSSIRARRNRRRLSVLDRQMYALFNVIWIVTLVVAFGSSHIFREWAQSAIWSLAYGIALIFVGTQGNRYAFAGGLVLIASIVIANIAYPIAGYVFAAGMWIGMAGTGVALAVTQRGCE